MQEVHIIKKKQKMKCKYHNNKFTPKYPFQKFCLSDDECIKAFNEFVKAKNEKQRVKQWQKEKKVIKESLKTKSSYKDDLQYEINQIIKYIDKNVNCISSGRPLKELRNSGHIYAVGGNDTLRFNLDNIYNQSISDNKDKGGKPLEALEGIKEMYGINQYNLVLGLKAKYKYLGLSIEDLKEKIKIARQIVKELQKADLTYSANVRLELRKKYNERLGIYV